MRLATYASITSVCAVALVCAAAAVAGGPPVEALYQQLVNANAQLRDETGQARGEAVVRLYRQLTADAHPCAQVAAADSNTDDLFRATAFAELYSLEATDVDTLGCLYRTLAVSGAATDWHTRTYVGALVSVSRYAEANALRLHAAMPSMPVLPQLEVSPAAAEPGWRMLALKDATHAWVDAWKPAAHRAYVVAVVHPACAFSVRALSDIEQRPELKWLRDDLLLVVPPDASLPVSGLLTWNAAHPRLPMHPMYLRSDWKALTSLDTPTFYLVRDGQVLSSFEGWPNAAGMATLQAAMAR